MIKMKRRLPKYISWQLHQYFCALYEMFQGSENDFQFRLGRLFGYITGVEEHFSDYNDYWTFMHEGCRIRNLFNQQTNEGGEQ